MTYDPITDVDLAIVRDDFWSKVEVNGDGQCWPWLGFTNNRGYGYCHIKGNKKRGAHRISYRLCKGELSENQVIDHLCRNPICVNPAHLEAVSNRENTIRGVAGEHRKTERANATHCNKGHDLTAENIRLRKDGAKDCLACYKQWTKNNNDKRRERRNRQLSGGENG